MNYMNLKSILAMSTCAMAVAISSGASADSFNIPAGDLKTALDLYIHQSGAQLVISYDAVKGARTQGVKGDLPSDAALTRILSGTGFTVHRYGEGSMAIVRGKQSSLEIQSLQLAQAAPSGRIEEVLVTARRREEAVENIPISITALSSEDLKTFGIRNFADLEGVVPGLSMGGGGNGVKKDSNPFIRGIGQRETKVTLDPAVATYIDGIYIGRAAGAMLDIVDVQNVQVLRGPQGTLFGRNATGGALSVQLKKPNNNWEAQVSANIGNYGRRDLMGIINVPFMEDVLMGRLMVSSTNSNGYFTNIVDNTKWGGDNRVSGIAQLRFAPTDNLTFDLLGERTRIRETPRPQKCMFVRDPGFITFQSNVVGAGQITSTHYFKTFEDHCRDSQALPPSMFASDLAIGDRLQPKGRYWVDTSTLGLTSNWDVGDVGPVSELTIKSITAWRKTMQIADEDLDGIPAPGLLRIQPSFDRTTQLSQELQFSGRALNDRLFFSTGIYFFKEKTPENFLHLSAGVSPMYGGTELGPESGLEPGAYTVFMTESAREKLETNNKAKAWYGQVDYDITPEFQLTAGARWTEENRWSRYSKSYVDPRSVYPGYVLGINIPGIILGVLNSPDTNPILDWVYGTTVYSLATRPNGDIVLDSPTFVRDMMQGDELDTTDVSWTPMASLKYKADDRMLHRLSLDQLMVYGTYSHGFHAGGVTAGALDFDQNNWPHLNVPANTGIPCPNNRTSCFIDKLAEPGAGTADPQIFEPEKVVNYELGFKLAAFDRRLQANFAAFYMNYSNMQVTATASRMGIPIPFIENVGKSIIKGIELEMVAMPTSDWRVIFNGSYTDADIKEWDSNQIPLGLLDGADLGLRYTIDRSEERLPRVPRWQFFASTDYSFRLPGGGTLTPSVGVRFTSSIYHGFDRGSWVYTYGGHYYNHDGDIPPSSAPNSPACTQPVPATSCGWSGGNSSPQADPRIEPAAEDKWKATSRPTAFVDARLAWVSSDGKMEASLWGRNLTNKDDYLVGGISLADVTGAVGQIYANPRTFGLNFTYHFGE